MLSMTGYGYAERLTNDFLLTVEVKSYNNRYLEINHTMPNSLSRFEQRMDEQIKSVSQRGHVDLNIRLRQLRADLNLHVDHAALEQYRSAYSQIADAAGIAKEPVLRDYIDAEGVLVSVRDTDISRYEKPLFELLEMALRDLKVSKQREGDATKVHLKQLGDALLTGLDTVAGYADALEERLKTNLLARFEELLGSKGYDENRFLQEVAILLTKYSVSEELVRLKTHIELYMDLLDSPDPVGKRLDFLCQEMNREINTIGSKSIMAEINHQVVGMKDSLENIREQVRNIE
ncbi:MAG TPA: YicC/YloC family endoribonuclease [Sphaerochaetaceae bacterium]|nr:YicC/YloC family endoribonuclease [Sphaerochaetaceae bacterium]